MPTKTDSPCPDLPSPKNDLVEVPFCGDLLVVLDVVLFLSDRLRNTCRKPGRPCIRVTRRDLAIGTGRTLPIHGSPLPLASCSIIRHRLVGSCRTYGALGQPLVESFVCIYIMHVYFASTALEDMRLLYSCVRERVSCINMIYGLDIPSIPLLFTI